jgi:hypothetical protein
VSDDHRDDEYSEEDEPGESAFERFRRTASGVFHSDVVKDAFETTKDIASRGGNVITSLYDGAKNTVTQEEAWVQMERSIEELTSVVRVQHAMILDLLVRVTHLEASAAGGSGSRS